MLVVFTRAIIVYVFLLIAMRLMGKRQLGELQPFEFSITLIVAELACIPMTETSIPIAYGIIPMFTMFILHLCITKIAKNSVRFNKIFNGKPLVLINKNGIDYDIMQKVDLSLPDLMEAVRTAGYFDLSQIAFAILETNGSLSVLPKTEYAPLSMDIMQDPESKAEENYGLIMDGKILCDNVQKAGKTTQDVVAFCRSRGHTVQETLCLFLCGDNVYYQSKKGSAITLKWTDGCQKSI